MNAIGHSKDGNRFLGLSMTDKLRKLLVLGSGDRIRYNYTLLGNSGQKHLFDAVVLSNDGGKISCILLLRSTNPYRYDSLLLHYTKSKDVLADRVYLITDKPIILQIPGLDNRLPFVLILVPSEELDEMLYVLHSDFLPDYVHDSDARALSSGTSFTPPNEKRTRTRITYEVLQYLCHTDTATITQLVRYCNINHSYAKKVLNDLIKDELIRVVIQSERSKRYEVTESGLKVLNHLREAGDLIR